MKVQTLHWSLNMSIEPAKATPSHVTVSIKLNIQKLMEGAAFTKKKAEAD